MLEAQGADVRLVRGPRLSHNVDGMIELQGRGRGHGARQLASREGPDMFFMPTALLGTTSVPGKLC